MSDQQNVSVKFNWRQMVSSLVITVVAMAILVAFGYFSYQFVIERVGDAEARAEKALTEARQLQNRLDQAQNSIDDLQQGLQKTNLASNVDWSPVTIEHLVRMADLTLNTTGDVNLAITFLLAAKGYAKNPELSSINHALNKDIASLQAVSVIDSSDLILKIEALSQKADSLPIVAKQFHKSEKPTDEEVLSSDKIWKRILNSAMYALKGVVSIRREATEPLLLPEQETVLRLNIQAKLLQAEFAVMQKQNELYQSCLDSALRLIERYFVANGIVAADILAALKELKEVNLQTKIPFLTGSIAAVADSISANKKQKGQAQEIDQGPELQNQGTAR